MNISTKATALLMLEAAVCAGAISVILLRFPGVTGFLLSILLSQIRIKHTDEHIEISIYGVKHKPLRLSVPHSPQAKEP